MSRREAHDLAAERVVLGAMMQHPRTIDEVTGSLVSADFYDPRHASIYAAVTALAASGGDTGPIAVAHLLSQHDELGKVGGAPYLLDCVQAVPTVANACHYADIVAGHAFVRRAQVDVIRLQRAVDSGDRDAITAAQAAYIEAVHTETSPKGWPSLLTDGAAFVLDVPDKVPAVMGDDGGRVAWAQGEALMICGPSGVGKTTLAGQLVAARLGLMRAVLGFSVDPGTDRVLYLACDRPSQAARSLRRTMRPDWRDELARRLVVWKGPPPADFAKQPDQMLAMVRQAGADTVVVDSVKDVALGIADDVVGAGYNRARQITLAAGVEVLELHHQVKRNAKGGPPTTLADVYGSVWLTAGAGSVLLLWGEPGDPVVRLTHLKQPAEEIGPLDVLHDHQTGLSTVHHQADLAQLAAHAPAGITAPEAARVVFDTRKPSDAQVAKARRRLDRLVSTGRLMTMRGRAGGDGGSTATTYHATAREPDDRR